MRIQTPAKGYSGVGAGEVVFADGVGYTDNPALIAYFRQAGYTVTAEEDQAQPETAAKHPTKPRSGTS